MAAAATGNQRSDAATDDGRPGEERGCACAGRDRCRPPHAQGRAGADRTEGFGRNTPGARAVPAEATPASQPAAGRDKDKDKDKATEAKATGQAGDKPGETSSDPAGEKAVRAAIEADGYKGVTVIRKGANGVWHASALRGKTTVMLTVDGSGSVSAD